MKQFNIILEEKELNNNFEPISRKTISNQHITSSTEDDKTYEFAIKEITQCTLNSFIANKDEMPSVPIRSITNFKLNFTKEIFDKFWKIIQETHEGTLSPDIQFSEIEEIFDKIQKEYK